MKYEVYEKPEANIIDLGEAILTDTIDFKSSNANSTASTVAMDIETFFQN